MAAEEGIIAALSILQFLLYPHTMYQLFPALIIIGALVIKLRETKDAEMQVLRMFGTIIITVPIIVNIKMLQNLAYTGTPQSIFGFSLAILVSLLYVVGVESIVYKTVAVDRENAPGSSNSQIYETITYILGISVTTGLGMLFTGMNVVSTAATATHSQILFADALRVLSVIIATISVLMLIDIIAKGTEALFVKAPEKEIPTGSKDVKNTLHMGCCAIAAAIGTILFSIRNNNTWIAAILGVSTLILTASSYKKAVTTLRKTDRDDIRNKGKLLLALSIAYISLAILPTIYLLFNPAALKVDCTQNFTKANSGTIFAYGPQEVIIYPKKGTPIVILPWNPKTIDINVFCSARKFYIYTSLGKTTCDPKGTLCK